MPDFASDRGFFQPSRASSGKLIVLVFLLLGFILALTGGILGYLGIKAEERFSRCLEEGMAAVEKDQGDKGAELFSKALNEQGLPLTFFRTFAGLKGRKFTTPDEVLQMAISALLMKAYDDLFSLKWANLWVEKAEEKLKAMSKAPEAELTRSVATARELTMLCAQFEQKKYAEVMKGLLTAEKNAQPEDQDFFIMEVRLLIACGKALNEPAILDQARELLWFLTSEAGIKGPRMDRLWGLLYR